MTWHHGCPALTHALPITPISCPAQLGKQQIPLPKEGARQNVGLEAAEEEEEEEEK